MSEAAARIIKTISQKGKGGEMGNTLGTVQSVGPISLQLDDVGFPITTGIQVNKTLPKFDPLVPGDRVLVACINNSCYVIQCKVVAG